ncbi:MAG: hypothetical protein L0G99_10365 [Propionibacteriales bacterium]|nr:hypothetical protein [Propionibacteriales bacterium]
MIFDRRGGCGLEDSTAVLMQTWKDWADVPPILASAQSTWVEQNPSMQLDLYDDDRMLAWLADHPGMVDVDALRGKSFIRVVDLFRYAYLLVEGGMYVDMDFVAVRPIDRVLDRGASALLGSVAMPPELSSHSVPNAWMWSPEPGHPVWAVALGLASERIGHHSIEFATGPELIRDAVNIYRRMLASGDMMPIERLLQRYGVDERRFPDVEVLPVSQLYPVSWSDPDHQSIRAAFRAADRIDADLLATVPMTKDTVAFTFWYNSWDRD